MNITFRQLQIFRSVGKHLSITKAAKELFLTQPAVSMQIKQLESSISSPLIKQTGKKIYLTEAGKLVLNFSEEINTEINKTVSKIESLKEIDGGLLKVSVGITVNYAAAPILAKFCQQYSRIRVNYDVTNRATLIKQLEKNETDLALMGSLPEDADINAEPFLENPLVVIASPNHPLAKEKNIPLSKLKDDTLLMREVGSGTRLAIEHFFMKKKNFKLISIIEMNSIEAIKQSVETGLGLGIVSLHTIALEKAAGRLVVLDVKNFPIIQQWFIVMRKGKRLSAAATCFKQFILENNAPIHN